MIFLLSPPHIILPQLLYAETHYSFRGIYSRLKKNEPEVLADVPHRLDPGHSLPVLLLIKDAHRYPVAVGRIEVSIDSPSGYRQREYFDLKNRRVRDHWWHTILPVSVRGDIRGPCSIRVFFELEVDGRKRTYTNDNYRIRSTIPFLTYVSDQKLPHFRDWMFGDLHYHSSFTEDQVEFGAPLAATARMARAMGLHFFATTDHSYDLDDSLDNPLENDPELPKWRLMREQVAELNRGAVEFAILPGEELSCGNAGGRNVHLLLFDEPKFFPGSGDSAEKWFRNSPQLMAREVLARLSGGSLAYAAHPEIRTPLLQWFLIRRGRWKKSDYLRERLNGMQILNGVNDKGYNAARRRWIRLLLEGNKKFIIAGNDGHGNFNKFKQIGFPFLTLREHRNQIFGGARTGAKIEGTLTVESLKEALRRGNTVVTTGPMLEMNGLSDSGEMIQMGESCSSDNLTILLKAASSPEFGALKELKLYLGDLERRIETVVWQSARFASPYRAEQKIPLTTPPGKYYLRAELTSLQKNRRSFCLTNPIWVKMIPKGQNPRRSAEV